jgi:hypothetical protein
MSITFAHRLPESFIRELFEADHAAGAAVTSEKLESARTWLRRILVDFEALDQHIVLLQQLYGASFHYPRPRRDQWDMDHPIDPPTTSGFTHVDRLPDNEVAIILDNGIDGLNNKALGSLLLNPYALFDLFDVIDDVQPEYWLDAIHDLVTAQSPARRAWPPFVETRPRPEDVVSQKPVAASTEASNTELRQSLDSALTLSKQLSDVLVREAPSQRSRGLQYAMALAAAIAIMVASWGVLQLSIVVPELRMITSQQAEIQRLTQDLATARKEYDQLAQQTRIGAPLVTTSDQQNRPVDWLIMVKEFYDPKASAEDNIKSLETHGGDTVRAKVAELRSKSPQSSAAELLRELFHSWGMPDIRQ